MLADGSKVYPRHSVIEFYTLTNGCTTDNSFEVEVKQGKKRQKISVFRVVKDMCKGVTRWIKIEKKLNQPLAWEVPVAVANPFPAEFEIVY